MKQKKWIAFDTFGLKFRLEPTNETQAGLERVRVILDDSKSKSEYIFNFWVNESAEEGVEADEGSG